jgi:hypothetical protein
MESYRPDGGEGGVGGRWLLVSDFPCEAAGDRNWERGEEGKERNSTREGPARGQARIRVLKKHDTG